jgi:hypothetical protein
MQVDDYIVDRTPGMAVTVEISIGSRTVMSYLLSLLLKYAHDSLREKRYAKHLHWFPARTSGLQLKFN